MPGWRRTERRRCRRPRSAERTTPDRHRGPRRRDCRARAAGCQPPGPGRSPAGGPRMAGHRRRRALAPGVLTGGTPPPGSMAAVPDGERSGVRDYLSILVRRKWVVILTVFVVACSALGYSLLQTPIYEAHARVRISP